MELRLERFVKPPRCPFHSGRVSRVVTSSTAGTDSQQFIQRADELLALVQELIDPPLHMCKNCVDQAFAMLLARVVDPCGTPKLLEELPARRIGSGLRNRATNMGCL